MNSSIIWGGIALGLITTVLLARIILKKWNLIKTAEQAKVAQNSIQKEKHEKAIESIKIIALCMTEEQVEPSEGCIRIKVLLDHVAPELNEQAPFSIFTTMYDATAHMPTHDARKKADKALIRQLDEERFALEKQHKDAILEAAKAIQHYSFL